MRDIEVGKKTGKPIQKNIVFRWIKRKFFKDRPFFTHFEIHKKKNLNTRLSYYKTVSKNPSGALSYYDKNYSNINDCFGTSLY